MTNSTTVHRAETLRRLHRDHSPLVLPTVWDVWSAKLVASAGFAALTIGSKPLALARGAEDHEGQELEDVMATVAAIVAAVDIPVSVDLESGYGRAPEELVDRLIIAGGAGLNVEDTLHGDGGRLRTAEEQAAYIAGLRDAAEQADVPLVINGRTDVFATAGDDRAATLPDALARMELMVSAGADVVYPFMIHDDDVLIAAVVQHIPVPVNITAHPRRQSLTHLADLGVGRVTFGPLLQSALGEETTRLLAGWR